MTINLRRFWVNTKSIPLCLLSFAKLFDMYRKMPSFNIDYIGTICNNCFSDLPGTPTDTSIRIARTLTCLEFTRVDVQLSPLCSPRIYAKRGTISHLHALHSLSLSLALYRSPSLFFSLLHCVSICRATMSLNGKTRRHQRSGIRLRQSPGRPWPTSWRTFFSSNHTIHQWDVIAHFNPEFLLDVYETWREISGNARPSFLSSRQHGAARGSWRSGASWKQLARNVTPGRDIGTTTPGEKRDGHSDRRTFVSRERSVRERVQNI